MQKRVNLSINLNVDEYMILKGIARGRNQDVDELLSESLENKLNYKNNSFDNALYLAVELNKFVHLKVPDDWGDYDFQDIYFYFKDYDFKNDNNDRLHLIKKFSLEELGFVLFHDMKPTDKMIDDLTNAMRGSEFISAHVWVDKVRKPGYIRADKIK